MTIAESVSLRPTNAADSRELCIRDEYGTHRFYVIHLSQIADLGEQCNQITYAREDCILGDQCRCVSEAGLCANWVTSVDGMKERIAEVIAQRDGLQQFLDRALLGKEALRAELAATQRAKDALQQTYQFDVGRLVAERDALQNATKLDDMRAQFQGARIAAFREALKDIADQTGNKINRSTDELVMIARAHLFQERS